MVQQEIIKFLEDKKAYLPDRWFTTKEVKEGVKNLVNPQNVHKSLVKLWIFNIVEFKGKHILDKSKTWRIK